MPQFPLDYLPGVVSDDTVLVRGGRYTDANGVRWVRAGLGQPLRPQLIGGWERLVTTALTGVCRSFFFLVGQCGPAQRRRRDPFEVDALAGGALYDITPSSGFTAGAVDGAGGGSGFANLSYVSSATLTAGSGTTPGNSGDCDRGTSGNAGVAGRVILS